MELFGIKLMGLTAENGRKLLKRMRFWSRQVWHLVTAALVAVIAPADDLERPTLELAVVSSDGKRTKAA